MNLEKTVNVICLKLKQAGFSKESAYLKEPEIIGSTGGEIFDLLISRILELKRVNISAYNIFKTEAELIIEYAKQIGHL